MTEKNTRSRDWQTINKKKSQRLWSYPFLFILPSLLVLSFPGSSTAINKENTDSAISASYTTINEQGNDTFCTVSSNDSIETLNALKNSDCKLPVTDENGDLPVILVTHSPSHGTKQRLLTTRKLLMWAYMAVHLYKVWDSGGKLLWPPVCPCSGQPKTVTGTQKFFFTYYVTGLLHHGWHYLSPYFLSEQTTRQYRDSTHDSNDDPTENRSETLTSILSTVFSKTTNAILSLALDAAALRWDCQCAGYFTDASGGFYFNGHLWMLLLNIAIFATDLAIDYL